MNPIGNNIFLEIDKALVDEITTESGFKLYLAPEYNIEHNVSVTGRIKYLPKNYSGELKVNDEVAFSYKVISDRTFPNTADWFVPVSEGNTNVRMWRNSKGEKLRMMAYQGAISIFWTGTYFNKDGLFQYGTQGSEKEVENWMARNFKFGNTDGFIFKNLFFINGENLWKCPLEYLYAKKEGEKIKAIGDRIICKMIEVPIKKVVKIKGHIHLPDDAIKVRYYDRGKIVSGGGELGFKKGNTVSFDDRYCEKYTLFGKDYFLIKKNRVQGQWTLSNK